MFVVYMFVFSGLGHAQTTVVAFDPSFEYKQLKTLQFLLIRYHLIQLFSIEVDRLLVIFSLCSQAGTFHVFPRIVFFRVFFSPATSCHTSLSPSPRPPRFLFYRACNCCSTAPFIVYSSRHFRDRNQNPSGVVPFLDQEITEASVSQDSASTTVSFTRPLVPAGAKQPLSTVPGDATIIIFAFGMDNTLGYHGEAPNRGGVVLDLFCGDTAAGGDGSAAGTPSPAAAASSTVPSAAPTAVVGGGGGGGGGATGEEATPAPAAVTGAPTLGDTAAPAAVTAAPTLAEGATMAPTIMMAMTPAPADMPTSSPDGDRDVGEPGLDTSSTPAPAAGGDSVNVTTAPTSAPTSFEDAEDGSGQDTDGASRVAGGKWAAAAVTGVVAMLAALSL